MYALAKKSGHVLWKEQWYALTLGVSLGANFYMIRKDQLFVIHVVVIDMTWEMVDSSVISRLIGATTKLSAIVKIHKYKRFHEGHHFILMAMEVHNTPKRDIDRFIRECVYLFHYRWSKGHLSLSFCI